MSLFIVSIALSVLGALLALVCAKAETAAKIIGCLFGVAAGVCALIAGLMAVFGPPLELNVAAPFFNFHLLINPLSGLLVSVIAVLAIVAWLFGLSYFNEYRGKGIGMICFFMNLFIASMCLLLCSDNAFWFLVFFEIMSLTSYFLVVTEQDSAAVRGGFLYLVMAHIGFFLIMIAFLTMAGITGSFEFSSFRETQFTPVVASLVFLLGFVGFGIKAGMVPFHTWLPEAHPAAPSNVSALMSGGMIKIGIFGIIKVAFDLLAASGTMLWWGVLVVLIGVISALFGIAYALAERDLKRLLAYSSVENIGIILIAVGIALIGWAEAQPLLAVIGLMAALYHLVNHAMFKGLLFLGAGSVLYATGTRNMELMGGLSKLMPVSSICFLLGSLAISAIPPLNGFVSEWFIYQGLITGAMDGSALIKIIGAFAAVCLALTGALAATCFVKAYGVTFLGQARSEAAGNAKEVPLAMKLAMICLATLCVLLGVGAPWVVPVLDNIAVTVLGASSEFLVSGTALVNPAIDAQISTPLLAILLIAAIALVIIVRSAKAKGGIKRTVEPWANGYLPSDDMPLKASSFAGTSALFFNPFYRLRDNLISTSPTFASLFSGFSKAMAKAQNFGDVCLVEPTRKLVSAISQFSTRLEGGDFRVYIVYVVIALVFFLVLAVLVK